MAQNLLNEDGSQKLVWQSWSPDMNHVEHFWNRMDRTLRKKKRKNTQESILKVISFEITAWNWEWNTCHIPLLAAIFSHQILHHTISRPFFDHYQELQQTWTHQRILLVPPQSRWPKHFFACYWLVKEVASFLLFCHSYQVLETLNSSSKIDINLFC